ncbi:hypothetical protein J4727_06900 [Providencia rettgeri]|uniref:Uncharacterized protein n=1 Tax=Providencia rettgeri TaxID=587 RepID=A0A939NF85_PRORE|nr:hypothetical protein [Providencia rettgeri]
MVLDIEYQLVEKKALFAYPAGTPVASLPKQDTVSASWIDYLASQQQNLMQPSRQRVQDALGYYDSA